MSEFLFFYDTETTGLPDWKAPSEAEHQPHIVQLAALVVDPVTRRIVQSMDVICRPDGWMIPDDVAAVHGITTKYAAKVGIPEAMAVEMFMELWAGRLRVGHNEQFDARIVRIAMKRFLDPREPARVIQPSDEWKDDALNNVRAECTARLSSPILDLAPTEKMQEKAKGFKRKTPTLKEAYEHLTACGFEDAHNAMADARACMDVYFAIKDLEKEAA